ncbi:MAG: HWE histidine kinase domain-containing protein [Sphingomicrobium sp.]
MSNVAVKSGKQKDAEEAVDVFRRDLGPFVVAAEKTRLPIIFTDANALDHPIIFANAAFLGLTGYDHDEVLGKKFKSLLAVAIGGYAMATVEAEFARNGDADPEIHYRRKDGSEFWASIFVSPVWDSKGILVQHFVSFVDLTRHKQDNARDKMMIDELNHRVKNTLSTVQAIVTLVLRQPSDPATMREAIESRLLALSRSHDLLTSSNWLGAGLHDLVDTALEPFEVVAGRTERFTIRGANVQLSPQATLSLAIALHELATNAVKYGAFSNDAGTIAIDWAEAPGEIAGETGERLLLRWIEQGGPPVAPPTRKGFGSWVIERGLTHELGGRVSLDYLPDGVACRIELPTRMEARA